MLEIIALNAAEALAGAQGGADRIELVGTMDDDGLSATVDQVRRIREVSDIPIRAMVRDQAGFTPKDLEALACEARELTECGVEALVVGWVTGGCLDTEALAAVAATREQGGPELTIHRAIDNTDDYAASWKTILDLREKGWNITSVLTAGSAQGVEHGMSNLCEQAQNPEIADLMMVGGGLKLHHIDQLREAGIHKFHVGSAIRAGGFDQPIDPKLVEQWVSATRR